MRGTKEQREDKSGEQRSGPGEGRHEGPNRATAVRCKGAEQTTESSRPQSTAPRAATVSNAEAQAHSSPPQLETLRVRPQLGF